MKNPLLVGFGLGLVAAVAFVSATTGPIVARVVFFFLTPLPMALAGLGWGWQTAVTAGTAATALLALVAAWPVALLFAVSQALPVVALTYLALLNRAVFAGSGTRESTEWYPPGRLVIWAALIASVLSSGFLLLIGADLEDLRKALGEFIETTVKTSLQEMPGATPLGEAEIRSLTEITLAVLPAASAVSWMASLLFNLWLGGRITFASGQLTRPWPDLAAIDFPRGTALLFAGALLATALEGRAGLAASSLAGVLFLAYVLSGLAIIHYTTRGRSWRPFALWALYAALLLVNVWIGILIAMVGLAEPVLQLRRRYPPRAGPPSTPVTG